MKFSKSFLKNMSKVTDITKIWFGSLPDASNLNAFRLYYYQNGCEKNWDVLKTETHDIVFIVYNETTKKFLFKKQFRPSVYHNFVGRQFDENLTIELEIFPPSLGEAIELLNCKVEIDKCPYISVKDTLKTYGYLISSNQVEKVITYKSGVGTSSSYRTLFYCVVSDQNQIPIQNDADVNYEMVEYSEREVDLLFKDFRVLNCTPDLLFSALWVLNYKIRMPPKEIINNPPVFLQEKAIE